MKVLFKCIVLSFLVFSLGMAGCGGTQPASTTSAPSPSQTTLSTTKTGEQVDEACFARNFTDIHLHKLPQTETGSMTQELLSTPVTIFEASELGIGWHISTTSHIDTPLEVTIKVSDRGTGNILMAFQPETPLEPNSGDGGAFPMPPAGQYEISFYVNNVLVKVIDFDVK